MLFGLKTAPATFEGAMEAILSSVKWQSALVHLDNIVVFSETVHDHVTHLWRVLTLLQKADVTLKLKKLLLRGDNQLPGSRHKTRKAGNRGNNGKGDSRIAGPYIANGITVLSGPFQRLLTVCTKRFAAGGVA